MTTNKTKVFAKRFLSLIIILVMMLCNFEVAFATEKSFTAKASAGKYVRECMVNRDESVSFVYKAAKSEIGKLNDDNITAYAKTLVTDIFNTAFKHTGVGNEGDYLQQSIMSYTYSFSSEYTSASTTVNLKVGIEIKYYSTSAQENELTSALMSVKENLNLTDKTDYEKVRTIINWINDTVTYDYEHMNDQSYVIKQTAYGAVINHTSVCQGYATLFYRLALESGLDCRILTGYADNGSGTGPERHAWNIVKVDGKYYYIDPTWIDGTGDDTYFLKGAEAFSKHIPENSFFKNYTVSDKEYIATPDSVSNKAGDSATWKISADGVLTVSGTGKVYNDFVNNNAYLSEHCEDITAVVIGNGITALGDNSFSDCSNMTSVSLPSTLKTLGKAAFSNCTGLTSVDIPDGVTELPQDLFFGDYSITEIKLPKNLKAIRYQALACRNLYEIIIPATVTTIEAAAFSGSGVTYVCFKGTKAQWNKAVDYTDNDCLTDAKKFFDYYDGKEICYDEGYCGAEGENLKWQIVNDKLIISGSGEMKNYYAETGSFPCHPWVYSLKYKNVKTVIVEDGVTSITDYAFCYSEAEKVILADSLTAVPANAFVRNETIKEINIPDNLGVNSEGICFYLSALEKITVSENCKNYYLDSNGVLFKKSNNKLLTVSNGVKEVKVYADTNSVSKDAFKNCNSLEKITVDEANTKYFGDGFALYRKYNTNGKITYNLVYCATKVNITEYTCLDGTTEIDENAFANNKTLKKITIPESVTCIRAGVFKGCNAEEIYLPAEVDDMGNCCFDGCKNLKTVNLPAGTDNIYYDFNNCVSLESIKLPEGIRTIGEAAFCGCSSLKSVQLPSDLEEIGFASFQNCTSLKNIEFPAGLKTIGVQAFYGCTALESLIVPDGVTEIGNLAFDRCTALKSVKLGNSIENIGTSAFYYCESLESIEIPDSVTDIGIAAFCCCTALKSVKLSANLSAIKTQCFADCVELSAIDIPAGVTEIGDDAFFNAINIKFNVDKNSKYFTSDEAGSLYNKAMTKLYYNTDRDSSVIVIRDSVKTISEKAFFENDSLKTVVIPEGVTSIPNRCFAKCDNLTSVYLPKSITEIDVSAFSECGNLKKVYFAAASGTKIKQTGDCTEFRNAEKIYSCIYELNHSFTKYVSNNDATCTKDGTKTAKCDRCDVTKTVTDKGSAKGHSWNSGKVTKAATCKASGVRTYTCTVCKANKTETIAKTTVHTWNDGVITTKASCAKTGIKTYTCTVCKATKTETIAKSTTHTYKNVVTAATLTKAGKIQSKCSVCGKVAKTTAIAKIASVKLSKTAYTYTGKALKPTVTVKDSNGKVIKATNYTVTYKNNTNVGKATVTVKFKGNYSGTKTLTFTISPKATTISKVTSPKKATATVTVKKQATQTTGYEIQYSTSSKFTAKTTKTVKITSAKTLTKTISKLTSGKTYYFRVRTYKTVSKVNYTSAWSTSVKAKIK